MRKTRNSSTSSSGLDVLFPETHDLIIKKSEGNPYFVKELVFSLIAKGALVSDSEQGKWRQTRVVTSLDLPDSLQSLLMARIDRLSPDERRVLQMAAVIGSVFWINALQAIAGQAVTHRTAAGQSGCITAGRADP